MTIVHSQNKLLNDVYPDKFRDRLAKLLAEAGVDIVYSDNAPSELAPGSTNLTTENGKTIPADLVVRTIAILPPVANNVYIPAWGSKPNTQLLTSLGPDVLSMNGFVKITETFQLQEYPNVFALGDIIDVKEQKQAAKAQAQAELVAANVLSFAAGQPPKKRYKGSFEVILVTIGKVRRLRVCMR